MARSLVEVVRGSSGRARLASLLAAVLAASAAFAAETGGPGPGLSLKEITSPAPPGSGEANLGALPDGRAFLSWIEPQAAGGHALRLAVRRTDGAWSAPRDVARGGGFFVNWADFPSVAALTDGTLCAHWLEKSGASTYAYEVRLARSADEGRTWSEALVPHVDRSAVEHGFVSMVDDGGGRMALVWLDGRNAGGTALLSARLGASGPAEAEVTVDDRVCDCCQTALVRTPGGLLAAYRDRSASEIRDIAVSRQEGGSWTAPVVVAADGWKIDGCPVNGPALAAQGDQVALAWFTQAPAPRVRLVLSADGGRSWGPPRELQEGRPLGRVDVAFLPGGDAVVSFLEASARGTGAHLRLRRVARDAGLFPLLEAAPTSPARSSGFPRLERAGPGLLLAWRDAQEPAGIHVAEVEATLP